MTVRVSLFFKPTAKEQWNKPNYSIQSRREPKMLTLRKRWEAAQSCLADEICLFGLQQPEQKEMKHSGDLGDVTGWQQSLPLGQGRGHSCSEQAGQAHRRKERWEPPGRYARDLSNGSRFWNWQTGNQLLTCRRQPPVSFAFCLHTFNSIHLAVLVALDGRKSEHVENSSRSG